MPPIFKLNIMKFSFIKTAILFCIVLCSCHKKDMPSPEPCTNPPCDSMVVPKDTFMVWQIPMLPDFTYGFSATPLIIDDKLIFTNRLVVQGEPINAVNKSTGELLWRNENSLTSSSSSVPFYYSGNKLAFLQHYRLSTWNIDTGNKIWAHPPSRPRTDLSRQSRLWQHRGLAKSKNRLEISSSRAT